VSEATAQARRGRFREVIGRFATGVTVVTTAGPAGLTTNAVTSLSLEPVLLLACFDVGSRTLGAVRTSGRFAVNVLAAGQDDIARRFATKDHDKFAGVSHRERGGVPILDGALAWLACEVRELHPGGDHVIGVGEVVAMDDRPGDPLLFLGGRYTEIAAARGGPEATEVGPAQRDVEGGPPETRGLRQPSPRAG